MISKKRSFAKILIFFLALMVLAGCARNPKIVRQTGLALGTVCTVSVYDSSKEKAVADSFALIKELEDKISRNIAESEISAINRNAGVVPVKVSGEVFSLLEIAVDFGKMSGGLFDLTVEPVVSLWGIGTERASVPAEDKLKYAVAKVDYRRLVLDAKNSTAYLPEKGEALDLGGVAKGYIADCVKKQLEDAGVSGGILDLGGNIVVFGKKPDKSDFRVGIQDPFMVRGTSLGIVSMSSGSVVTSGIYERYFESDGKRYHHIFDVRTGYPVENELVGVSVITADSASGDALSTTLFALGLEDGLAFVESDSSVEAVFITKEKEIVLTSGLKDNFELKDKSFKIRGAI